MDAIMKAASQSSRMPCFRKEAAIGIVPYMQSGEAIPRMQAGIIPNRPSFLSFIPAKMPWILSFANTEMKDPVSMPKIQYRQICRNWIPK